MALMSRLTLTGPPAEDPEDFLSASLGVIFPDDVTNQHGDADHGLLYTSPHLREPVRLSLAEPRADEERRLFSHYLWNASLLLAEMVEAGTLGLERMEHEVEAGASSSSSSRSTAEPSEPSEPSESSEARTPKNPLAEFDVTGLSTAELGAGTALPSLMAALLGAARVTVTDYPAPAVLDNLRANVARNARPALSPLGRVAASVAVEGHAWGDFSAAPFLSSSRPPRSPSSPDSDHPDPDPSSVPHHHHHAYDRVMVCDCLWMPWQHANLRRSIAWFMREDPGARAWVVAGFHTGRAKMAPFFEPSGLAAAGLEVERIWERDCNGVERPWAWDRGVEDVSERKRWLAVAVLRRCKGVVGGGDGNGNGSVEEPS